MPFSYAELLQETSYDNYEALVGSWEAQIAFITRVIQSIKFIHKDNPEYAEPIARLQEYYAEVKIHILDKRAIFYLIDNLRKLSELSKKHNDQSWFMKKMQAAGYTLHGPGECGGITSMAMQAFFLKNMDTFDARLQCIHDLPISYFEDNFAMAKKEIQTLTDTSPHLVQEKRTQLWNIIAFFDGVALYQLSRVHKGWFGVEQDEDIDTQDEPEATMPLVLPNALSLNQEDKPVRITSFIGGYKREDLAFYFDTLKKVLGDCSFALHLKANGHFVGLFYDHITTYWHHVQPANLPSDIYKTSMILSKAIMDDFFISPSGFINPGLSMIAKLYVQEKHRALMISPVEKLSQDPKWRSLHALETLHQPYLEMYYNDSGKVLHISALTSALLDRQFTWLRSILPQLNKERIYHTLMPVLRAIHSEKTYKKATLQEATTLCLAHMSPHKRALAACALGNMSILLECVSQGVKITSEMLETALKEAHDDMALSLMDKHGVKPTPYHLSIVYQKGTENTLLFSMLRYFDSPPEAILNEIVSCADYETVDKLIALGAKPTSKTLDRAGFHNMPYLLKWIDEGVQPSLSLVVKAYRVDKTLPKRMMRNGVQTFDLGHYKQDEILRLMDDGLPVPSNILEIALNRGYHILYMRVSGDSTNISTDSINERFTDRYTAVEILESLIAKQKIPEPSIILTGLCARLAYDGDDEDTTRIVLALKTHMSDALKSIFFLVCQNIAEDRASQKLPYFFSHGSNNDLMHCIIGCGIVLTQEECNSIEDIAIRDYLGGKFGFVSEAKQEVNALGI